MKRILNYLLVLLIVAPILTISITANTTRYITLANPSVFQAKDQWEALGGASLNDAAVVVSGSNNAGGLFTKAAYRVAGSTNKGFTAYFNVIHTFEAGNPRAAVLTEGVVFVLAKNPVSIGGGGDGKGYFGMDQSIGFEVDLISQSNDFTGTHVHDRILINGLNQTEDNGLLISTPPSFKNLHVWIEYQASLNRVYFYVSAQSLKPSTPSAIYDTVNVNTFFNDTFHLGVTSASTQEATLELNSFYFLSNYDALGIDNSVNYVTDAIAPTKPEFSISKTGLQYNVNLTGSIDSISGVSEYEYSYNNIHWFTFKSGDIVFENPGFLYARSIDRAGNVSEVSMTRFFNVELSFGVIKERETNLYFLGQNVALPVNTANTTDYIKSWVISGTDTQVTNINQLTGPTNLTGQVARHLFNISYVANEGILPENLKTTHSILTSTYTLPEATKEGYRFTGWYENTVLYAQLDQSLTRNITLTAQFEPLTSTISFHDYNQNIITINITTEGVIRNIGTLSVPEGFIFVGFFTEPFGQGELIDTNTYIANAHTFRIYPHVIPAEETTSNQHTLLTLSSKVDPVSETTNNYIYVVLLFMMIIVPMSIILRGKYHGK